MSDVMARVYDALGGPWKLAAEIEAIPSVALTEYVWNEQATGLTHLVVSDRDMDPYGDVATVCGNVTTTVSRLPEFALCNACVKGADLA